MRCPTIDGWKELLSDGDRDNTADERFHSIFVRDELVYLRKAGIAGLPFGLLGPPPVSVWLPAGDYEIAVVHAAPHDRSLLNSPQTGFPFITMFDSCSVPKSKKTTRRIPLPHYDWGAGQPVSIAGEVESDSTPAQPNLGPIRHAIETVTTFPTPGGYVLFLNEPQVIHSDEHRECKVDFENLEALPREWTRNQLATLRRWLPREATEARDRVTPLVSSLLRREMFQGWFGYCLVGCAGLVLTKWGSFAILEPYHRRELLHKTVKFCIAIFIVGAAGWWFVGLI